MIFVGVVLLSTPLIEYPQITGIGGHDEITTRVSYYLL